MTEKETIELNLTNDEILHVALMAHERDITFNQMVEHILIEEIKRVEEQREILGKNDQQVRRELHAGGGMVENWLGDGID